MLTLAERRKKAVRKGLCSKCTARTPRPGNKQCDWCIAQAHKSRETAKVKKERPEDDGWCLHCQAYNFHRVHLTGGADADCPKPLILYAAEVLGLKLPYF